MSDIASLGIRDLESAYRRGELTPVAVLEQLLTSIDEDVHAINAFALVDHQAALRDAEASAARWASGASLGALDGVPVSIKDLMNVAGWPTRRGSLTTASDPPAAADAPLVALLRAAGCVVFGKTTTTEFGWTIESTNPHTGLTRNPVDPSRSAGGSSSGAAAQVAAGWGPLAIGSDAGGSVRIPASYCGVVGFKPSFGSIPMAAPASAFAEFAHAGPIARSVDDCVAAMAVLSKPDARDPASSTHVPHATFPPVAAARSTTRRLRIGWTLEMGTEAIVEPEIAAAFMALVERLAQAGHAVAALPALGTTLAPDMWAVWCSRIHESFMDWPAARREQLDPRLQEVYRDGEWLPAKRLAQARARLREFAAVLNQCQCEVDLIITPTSPTVAPPAGPLPSRDGFLGNGFAYPFNIVQAPALSLPLGRNAQGLPFGVQVCGQKYSDALVLAFGAELEARLATE